MKRIGILAAVVCGLLGSTTEAQTPTSGPITFTTVDSVASENATFSVTGVLEGTSTPTTRTVPFYYGTVGSFDRVAACQQLALVAMQQPGKYLFTLENVTYNSARCRITRVIP